jgi:hypothetical protein
MHESKKMSSPYAGMTRIRFNGSAAYRFLSPSAGLPETNG